MQSSHPHRYLHWWEFKVGCSFTVYAVPECLNQITNCQGSLQCLLFFFFSSRWLVSWGLNWLWHVEEPGQIFFFFFPFLSLVSDLWLLRSFQFLVLSVDFSFTCSDFLGCFLQVPKLREVAWFKAHRFQTGSPCSLISGFVFWNLERVRVFKFGNRIPSSNCCDIFIFGFLLWRVRVLQFHLNLTVDSVSISGNSRSSNVSLLQKASGI